MTGNKNLNQTLDENSTATIRANPYSIRHIAGRFHRANGLINPPSNLNYYQNLEKLRKQIKSRYEILKLYTCMYYVYICIWVGYRIRLSNIYCLIEKCGKKRLPWNVDCCGMFILKKMHTVFQEGAKALACGIHSMRHHLCVLPKKLLE